MDDNSTGGPPRSAREPDAHGQAALLLVESLIHALIEQSVITTGTAVEAVDVAVEVSREIEADTPHPSVGSTGPVALLSQIGESLRTDVPRN